MGCDVNLERTKTAPVSPAPFLLKSNEIASRTFYRRRKPRALSAATKPREARTRTLVAGSGVPFTIGLDWNESFVPEMNSLV